MDDHHYEDEDDDEYHHLEYYTDYIDTQGATSISINVTMERRVGSNTHNDGERVSLYNQNGGEFWAATQSTVEQSVREMWRNAGYGNTWNTYDWTYETRNNYDSDVEYEDTDYNYLHFNSATSATRWHYCTDEDWGYGGGWPSANAADYFIPSCEKHSSNWWGTVL